MKWFSAPLKENERVEKASNQSNESAELSWESEKLCFASSWQMCWQKLPILWIVLTNVAASHLVESGIETHISSIFKHSQADSSDKRSVFKLNMSQMWWWGGKLTPKLPNSRPTRSSHRYFLFFRRKMKRKKRWNKKNYYANSKINE